MDPRLQHAIGTPSIQSQAGELIRLALRALAELRQLDESLYERFVATRQAPETSDIAAARLRRLWEDTFGGMVQLLAYARRLAGRPPSAPPTAEPDELDFGDFDAPGPAAGEGAAPPEAGFDLEASDIGDLLAGIDEVPQPGEAERWKTVLEKVGAIEYGLRVQHGDATERLEVALAGGQITHVLALLDDTASWANEGVHAVVAAVYEAFVPEADVATVVPQYLTALKRALLVRSGIAALAAELAPHNAVLQRDDLAPREEALAALRVALRRFVASEVCRAMRAADRWELVQFDQELAEQPLAAARQTAEGLVKYLESLASVNQREVLVLHDQRVLGELREALATARELSDLSPRTAEEMLQKARIAVLALRGRHPATDRMLDRLAELAGAEAPVVRERLEELLAAAGG